jgi:hypothetical protein
MRALWLFSLTVVAVLVAAVAAGAVGSATPATKTKRTSTLMTVMLHTTSNNIVHAGTTTPNSITAKYASGDSQYWHGEFRSRAGAVVGSEDSDCFITIPAVGVCTSVDELPGGTIVHTGSTRPTALTLTTAITGGTGRYRGATGRVVYSWMSESDARVDYHLSWR